MRKGEQRQREKGRIESRAGGWGIQEGVNISGNIGEELQAMVHVHLHSNKQIYHSVAMVAAPLVLTGKI